MIATNSYAYTPDKSGSWSISLAPTVGMNLSIPRNSGLKQTNGSVIGTRIVNVQYYYYGLGLQGRYMEDWQLTLKYAFTGMGAGIEFVPEFGTPGRGAFHRSSANNDLNVLELNVERRVVKVPISGMTSFFSDLLSAIDVNVLWGIRYAAIPRRQQSDTSSPLFNGSFYGNGQVLTKGDYYTYRYSAGAFNGGMNVQFYIKEHRSLKLGAIYTYMPRDFIEHRWDIDYIGRYKDEVSINISKHQVLFYMEYPFQVYTNKKTRQY